MVGRMIGRIIAVAVLALTLFAPAANAQSQQADVVVELYTSQGCAQCPRGNRLVGMLTREERTLALTFPVGIWDYLGWRDTFAQPEFTERQRAYSRALNVRGRFTPQLIINGSSQISASYWDEARAAFDQAQARPLRRVNISITRLRSNRVRVALGSGAAHPGADIWLIPYDTGPIDVVVTRGVNRQRRILHYNLVTSVDRIGSWNGSAVYYEAARCAPQCAVIVQEPYGGPILAAAFTTPR
ncbi:MAG: DUF1223 domain-containing protein [Alphaproteobacteria bacterium]|nr:MAG: DUF1223 domain-containing protein [Alphaproteobacteria bacterium]